MPKLTASCPHFLVSNLETALDYYVDVLGFERPPLWGEPPLFAMPSRDELIVMLNQVDRLSPQPNGDGVWDAYFWCDDADELFSEVEQRGAVVEYAPIDRAEYGNREFAVRDPDGYVLAFGSDLAS